ncbi:hypothetical protein [Gulosibacter sp. 10]|uniref:DUF7882 family protein n=1 Tax=Gulosibacter sp. 10 TaxID=1255570 RepID=UPI00097EFC43|nr:hypothetical protein [Gulosibacter sp. 10]SJM62500.1 hypothetical protein FM112_08540 [Gulosibacter sp. 10]
MGYLIYGAAGEYEFDDRTLAHLKVVIGQKLRRQESFFLSWSNPAEKGSGRFSMWISPMVPIVFRFAGSRSPELNPAWLEMLHDLSNTRRGLVVIPEAEAEIQLRRRAAAEKAAEAG